MLKRIQDLQREAERAAEDDSHYQRLATKLVPPVCAYEAAMQTADQAHRNDQTALRRHQRTFLTLRQPDRIQLRWPAGVAPALQRAPSAPVPGRRPTDPSGPARNLRALAHFHAMATPLRELHANLVNMHRAVEGPPEGATTMARRVGHRRGAGAKSLPTAYVWNAFSVAHARGPYWADVVAHTRAKRDRLRPAPSAAARARGLRRVLSAGNPSRGNWRPPDGRGGDGS